MDDLLGIVHALPPGGASTCGYCSPSGSRSETESSFYSSDLVASLLTCEGYQNMIDRGWRRSGTYCYKPDLRRSCCPQYSIKLEALKYKPSRSQRKALNRWNRHVLCGDEMDNVASMNIDPSESPTPSHKAEPLNSKLKTQQEYSLISAIHASELKFITNQEPVHKFEVTLEPSSYTDEKFALFEVYQERIHKEEGTRTGFQRFLVDSPLNMDLIPYPSPPPDHLPTHFGTYHQTYRLDGKLIAMSVIDILPSCVSSVYFMYDNTWERFSLGKISAMREAALAKEVHDAGIYSVDALYLGFYVHSCTKMRYKGDYHPSYLADPENYTWWPFKDCATLLDKFHYACFSHIEHSLTEPSVVPNLAPLVYPLQLLENISVLTDQSREGLENAVVPLNETVYWSVASSRTGVITIIENLGLEVSKRMIFKFHF